MPATSQRTEAAEERVSLFHALASPPPTSGAHPDTIHLVHRLTGRIPQSEAGSTGLPDLGDDIDRVVFEQILEMDDDEDEREFSRSIVYGFFEQAEATFRKMETAL